MFKAKFSLIKWLKIETLSRPRHFVQFRPDSHFISVVAIRRWSLVRERWITSNMRTSKKWLLPLVHNEMQNKHFCMKRLLAKCRWNWGLYVCNFRQIGEMLSDLILKTLLPVEEFLFRFEFLDPIFVFANDFSRTVNARICRLRVGLK